MRYEAFGNDARCKRISKFIDNYAVAVTMIDKCCFQKALVHIELCAKLVKCMDLYYDCLTLYNVYKNTIDYRFDTNDEDVVVNVYDFNNTMSRNFTRSNDMLLYKLCSTKF